MVDSTPDNHVTMIKTDDVGTIQNKIVVHKRSASQFVKLGYKEYVRPGYNPKNKALVEVKNINAARKSLYSFKPKKQTFPQKIKAFFKNLFSK